MADTLGGADVQHRTCSVEGCDRGVRSRYADLCNTHYFRLRRTGQTGPAEIWDRKRKPCTVDGCDRMGASRGLCDKHYQRLKATGDPTGMRPRPAGDRHYAWRGDDITYHSAHLRVSKAKGRAAEHACSVCGGSARHWAYDHADPNQRTSEYGPYSTDPDHYTPMCVPCHKAHDLARLAR